MAAMTEQEIRKAARHLAKRIFVEPNATATFTVSDMIAAVTAVDGAFEGTPAQLPNQAQSVANNLNIVLPQPFKADATVEQKSTLLAVWAGVKYGYLTNGD